MMNAYFVQINNVNNVIIHLLIQFHINVLKIVLRDMLKILLLKNVLNAQFSIIFLTVKNVMK